MRLLVTVIVLCGAFVSCEGGGGGRGSTSRSSDRRALPPVNTTPSARGDRRLILVQSATKDLVIFVNEGHRGRATPEGQRAIVLGLPEQAYKVYSDEELDQLVGQLDELGYSRTASPFQPGEGRYLTRDGQIEASFRGLIYLEEAGNRRKLLGALPAKTGDAAAIDRLTTYSKCKTLLAVWFTQKSVSESPPF